MSAVVEAGKSKAGEWVVRFFCEDLTRRQENEMWGEVHRYFRLIACSRIRHQLLDSEIINLRFPRECLSREVEDIYSECLLTLSRKRDEIIRIKKNSKRKIVQSDDVKLICAYFLTIIRYTTRNHISKIENAERIIERPTEELWKTIGETKEDCHGKPLVKEIILFIRVKASQRVPKMYRDIVSARLMGDSEPSFREIGKKFKISEQTARQRYSRGIAKLREAIVEEAEEWLGKGSWSDEMLKMFINKLK